MNKYKAIIKYDGSKFYGWAKQPNGLKTVQGELENNIGSKVLSAGRTDRFVHAKNQVISFSTKKKLSKRDIYKLSVKLHQNIEGLKIKKISKVHNNFQPRFDSTMKTYEYYVDTSKIDNEYAYSWRYGQKINVKKVKEASLLLIGKKNFASFTAKENYKSFDKVIENIKINKYGKYVKFTIIGPRFMRFQVRNMVGALLAYDRGKYSYEQFKDLIDNPKKGKAHYKAPGSGLYLKKIDFS